MAEKATISKVVRQNLCHGCGTCFSLCPNSAIAMIMNRSRGIFLPEIDNKRCDRCGICLSVCSGDNVCFKRLSSDIFGKTSYDLLIGNYLNFYIGHTCDEILRRNSSSGGIITSILLSAMEEGVIDGALVTKMQDDKPLEPMSFIARTRTDIISALGSKYCPVPANIAIKDILNTPGRYAVVGLPCHIHSIRKAEVLNKVLRERIVLHIGLLCGSNISFRGTEFLLRKFKIKKTDIKSLSYRGDGWPGNLIINLKNSSEKISVPYLKYFDAALGSFIQYRCTLCSDKMNELADISCGDAWFSELSDNKAGESLVIVRSKAGGNFLEKIISQKKADLEEINIDKMMQLQGGKEIFASWKKKTIIARMNIVKLLFRRQVPVYDNISIDKPAFRDYVNSILLYMEHFIAHKRYLWPLLKTYWYLRTHLRFR